MQSFDISSVLTQLSNNDNNEKKPLFYRVSVECEASFDSYKLAKNTYDKLAYKNTEVLYKYLLEDGRFSVLGDLLLVEKDYIEISFDCVNPRNPDKPADFKLIIGLRANLSFIGTRLGNTGEYFIECYLKMNKMHNLCRRTFAFTPRWVVDVDANCNEIDRFSVVENTKAIEETYNLDSIIGQIMWWLESCRDEIRCPYKNSDEEEEDEEDLYA